MGLGQSGVRTQIPGSPEQSPESERQAVSPYFYLFLSLSQTPRKPSPPEFHDRHLMLMTSQGHCLLRGPYVSYGCGCMGQEAQ